MAMNNMGVCYAQGIGVVEDPPVALLRRESPAVKAGQRHRFRHADDRDGRHDDRYRPARNGRLAATGISAKPVLHTDKPSGKEY